MFPAFLRLILLPTGRQLVFTETSQPVAHVFRRVGGAAGPWQRLAVNTRSPFLDTDVFAPGTELEYYVQPETPPGALEVRSPLATATVQ